MSASTRPAVVAVVGATATGKTALAEGIAVSRGGEVVSADSMQVYRGMDVGTAKPVPPRRVPYHCIDLVDPGEPYSAARFQEDARSAIEAIAAAGRLPIVAGGTGLYVRAALDDWEIPRGHAGTPVRESLESDLAALGPAAMHDRLRSLDPDSAEIIHPNNSRRVLRALEMHAEGASYAEQAARFARRESRYPTDFLGLTLDRAELYARIDRRVDRMIEGGLLDEVRGLLTAGFREALTASQAIGYKELVPVVDGEADLRAAVDSIKRTTRRYAKRQGTWFRADTRISWIDVTDRTPEEVLVSALELLDSP